jgi:hypothetical protein
MLRSTRAVCLAVCAALAAGRGARAADPATRPTSAVRPGATTPDPPVMLPVTPLLLPPVTPPPATPSSSPLMRLLEAVGVGHPLEEAGFSLTGYVQGSFTHDFSSPPGGILTDRAFDTRSDSPQLDQLELLFKKDWDPRKPVDYGLTLENIYGTDTPYFHANGLTLVSYGKAALPYAGTQSVFNDYFPLGPEPAGIDGGRGFTATIKPRAQYDPTQLNFTIGTGTVASGIAFEGGKFADLLGAERISPSPTSVTNNFLSHSFIFMNEPFTNTGALGLVNLTPAIGFTAGITRGWDQATEDTNGSVDFYGQLRWTPNRKAKLAVSVISGDEQPSESVALAEQAGLVVPNGWRTVIDVVGSCRISDQLSVAVNGMYGCEGQTGNGGIGGGTGQWYALAGYASYRQSDYLSFNVRAEWFDDQDGAAPSQFAYYGPNPSAGYGFAYPLRRPNLYYELTIGTTIHPLPNRDLLENLFFRPEIRFDYADKSTFDFVTSYDNPAGSPTDHYFFTFGVDAVYAF